jgi:hypothetical protein
MLPSETYLASNPAMRTVDEPSTVSLTSVTAKTPTREIPFKGRCFPQRTDLRRR